MKIIKHYKITPKTNITYTETVRITKKPKKPVTNTCLLGLVNQTDTSSRYTKSLLTTQIKYVEPNIIVTWNLSKTILNQNCIKN